MGVERSLDPGELRERLRKRSATVEALKRRLDERERELELLRGERQSAPPPAPDAEVPVFFVVGQAKSGTSWLMRLLDAHPEVLCRGEGRIFGLDYLREDLLEGDRPFQPSSLYRAFLEADYLRAWVERSVWTRRGSTDEQVRELVRLTARHFLGAALAQSGMRVIGDKTPFLGDTILEEIGTIYPDARVVHIIRDGRDVAVSAMHHLWNQRIPPRGSGLEDEEVRKRDAYRSDPRAFAEGGEGIFTERRLRATAAMWKRHVGRARDDGARLLGDRYLEVRYEDLLERPEGELGRIDVSLGVDDGADTLRECIRAASFERWSGGRRQGDEDSAALERKGIAGDWRQVFTDADRAVFKQAAGEMLIDLGYERDGDW